MNRHSWGTWLLLAGALGAAACSGDDDAQTNASETEDAGATTGGSAGSKATGGKGGAAGKGGSGGSSQEASGRGEAEGGKDAPKPDDKPSSGGGGKAAAGSGGSGSGSSDDADAGSDIAAYPPVEKVADRVFTQANDLRGVTFSASGKIWASGHTDADPMNRKLVLARFNADGTADTSFDDDLRRGPG